MENIDGIIVIRCDEPIRKEAPKRKGKEIVQVPIYPENPPENAGLNWTLRIADFRRVARAGDWYVLAHMQIGSGRTTKSHLKRRFPDLEFTTATFENKYVKVYGRIPG